MKIKKIPTTPPAILYHGTSHHAARLIMIEGLLPMKRQYVHLSLDEETAQIVGKRRDENPVILIIDTYQALKAGTKFYIGNDKVWLSDAIPSNCITIK